MRWYILDSENQAFSDSHGWMVASVGRMLPQTMLYSDGWTSVGAAGAFPAAAFNGAAPCRHKKQTCRPVAHQIYRIH